uniref:PIH1 domain-containing protein n=1 Tax=Anopheles melas TaxID=34690 RepID=A0A182UEA4_9DIPT
PSGGGAVGFCVKAFKKGTEEKFFINLCQTDGIPPPRDITEDELIRILNDGEPNAFRIPMSITQPRPALDKSNQGCQVCDIAINTKFYAKIESGGLLREFLISVLFDGVENKYNVALDESNFRILKNKKFIDKLIPHNIQNRDVRQVIESYPHQSDADRALLTELDNPRPLMAGAQPKKRLIEEIGADAGTVKTVKNETNSSRTVAPTSVGNAKQQQSDSTTPAPYVPDPTKVAISQAATKKPEIQLGAARFPYKLYHTTTTITTSSSTFAHRSLRIQISSYCALPLWDECDSSSRFGRIMPFTSLKLMSISRNAFSNITATITTKKPHRSPIMSSGRMWRHSLNRIADAVMTSVVKMT